MNEELYRRILETIQEGVWTIDAHGVTTFANDNLAMMFGYAVDEMLGRPFTAFMDDDARAVAAVALARRQAGVREAMEFRFRHKQGHDLWTRVSTAPFEAADGGFGGALALVTDITAQRAAERALRESQARYALVERAAADGIWDWDLVTGDAYLSSRWKALLGYRDDELPDQATTFFDLLHADDRPAVQAAHIRHLESDERYDLEIRLRHQDGSYRWMRTRGEAVRDAAGTPVRMVGSIIDVTERKQAEAALAASQGRLQKIVDSLQSFVGVFTPDGIVVDLNRVAVETIGLRKQDAVGLHLAEQPYFAAQEGVPEQVRELLRRAASGEVVRADLTAQMHGQDRVFDATFGPLRDDAGAIVQVVGSGVDVTDRRHAEAALRATEGQLGVVLDNITDGFFILSRDWRYLNINPAAARQVGKPADELIGRGLFDVFPEAAGTIWDRTYREVMTSGTPRSVLAHDAELDQWHEADVYPLGEGIAVFVRDITVRKRTEEAHRTSEQRMREAQRIAGVGHWELDLVHDTLSWSDQIFQLFEIDKNLFGATYPAFLAAIHPEDRDAVNAAYTRSLTDRAPYEITHRLLMPDGRVKYVTERCESSFSADGKPLRSVGTVHDVSTLKHAEAALLQLNMELEQRVEARTAKLDSANRELEAFSYSVSHDLRAPLRGIDGFSQALEEDYATRLDATAMDYLARIRAGVSRMGTLIDDMLRLSRITREPLRVDRVDLSEVAARVVARLQATEPSRHVAVTIVPGQVVTADGRLIEVALTNLLGNAWKFTRGQPNAAIALGCDAAGREPVFFVRDNGAGFDPAYASKLFGAFQRLHSAHEFEGTGIGLATVQRIVRRHGGRVWAEGGVGRGATFYFTLPAVHEEAR